MLISNSELLESYNKNYMNSKIFKFKSIFFLYGQPDTCFSNQLELLIDNGAQLVFSAVPANSNASALYLHRIPLHSFNNSKLEYGL